MLEVLVALDVAQREMKNQFELDAPAGARVRRADRKHRSLFRAARALALRVVPRAENNLRPSRQTQTGALGGQPR